jgi:hypothetical protein
MAGEQYDKAPYDPDVPLPAIAEHEAVEFVEPSKEQA